MHNLESVSLRNGIRDATTEEEIREIGLRLEDVKTELDILQNRFDVLTARMRDLLY